MELFLLIKINNYLVAAPTKPKIPAKSKNGFQKIMEITIQKM